MSSVPISPNASGCIGKTGRVKKPVYLQLCHKTIARHRGEFELMLLDETTVNDFISVPKRSGC